MFPFSLPTQRCFRRIRIRSPASPLFSAYAEVFLEDALPTSVSASFLCLRRGVSRYLAKRVLGFDISLPTQRCFQAAEREVRRKRLFSAYAEVFPLVRQFESARWSFSLPTQRCFPPRGFPFRSNRLFSAYAEVFPSVPQRSGRDRSFLCLRRGVSRVQTDLWNLLYFSLPTQRCFCRRIQCRHCRGLFSAYAEVFLSTVSRRRKSLPFLCLRRGVSE